MGIKRRGVTVRDIERWIGQGRGAGEGISYKPWLRVQDVPSLGRSRRVRGLKSGRIHHLLSDLEYAVFLMAEYSQLIVDIREQFPLLPYGSTEVIAARIGVRHPVYPESATRVVMSHDFVLTMSEHAEDPRPVSLSVKYEWGEKDRVKRMLEKLEIERRFALEVGKTKWRMVTNGDFDPMIVTNLDWLHYGMRRDMPVPYLQLAPVVLAILRALNYQDRALSAVMRDMSKLSDLRGLSPWLAFKTAAWRGFLPLDLTSRILPCYKVKESAGVQTRAEVTHVA